MLGPGVLDEGAGDAGLPQQRRRRRQRRGESLLRRRRRRRRRQRTVISASSSSSSSGTRNDGHHPAEHRGTPAEPGRSPLQRSDDGLSLAPRKPHHLARARVVASRKVELGWGQGRGGGGGGPLAFALFLLFLLFLLLLLRRLLFLLCLLGGRGSGSRRDEPLSWREKLLVVVRGSTTSSGSGRRRNRRRRKGPLLLPLLLLLLLGRRRRFVGKSGDIIGPPCLDLCLEPAQVDLPASRAVLDEKCWFCLGLASGRKVSVKLKKRKKKTRKKTRNSPPALFLRLRLLVPRRVRCQPSRSVPVP